MANETPGVADSDWGDGVVEGYIEVEGLGGGEQVVRNGGGTLAKNQNRAAGAWFRLTKHRGCSIRIGGVWMGRGTLGLRSWEVGNERRVGVGWIGLPAKNRATGAWFWLTTCGRASI